MLAELMATLENALTLDGGDDWINLDPNSTGYLGDSLKDGPSWYG